MNPNVIIKMIHDNNSDIILNLFICLLFNGFSASSVLLLFKLAHNSPLSAILRIIFLNYGDKETFPRPGWSACLSAPALAGVRVATAGNGAKKRIFTIA